MSEFVHLHVHSDFSLQDAAVTTMALADRAEALGMSHLALTDHGNMFGVMEFIAACAETVNEKGDRQKRKNPVKPIIGCEVYVSPQSRFEKKGSESENKYHHLVLLAANREGYFNLVRLCSLAYTEGFYYRPRIDEELLAKYHGGLIALSACIGGEIPRLIQTGKTGEAEKKALFYRDLFGRDSEGNPNFYLEIQEHGIPASEIRDTNLSQKEINVQIAAISRKTGIPLVATNDVHYLKQEDYVAHDILLCIGTGKVRTEEKRIKYHGDQFYFKTGAEMAALFGGYEEAVANTVRIAKRCVTDVPKIEVKDLPQYLPDFDIPAGFDSAPQYLRHLTDEGLKKRYPKEMAANGKEWETIQKRAAYELDVIIGMSFTGYFLIVADFINYAKKRGIPVGPGRGSGAGSIIAYALRITNIDPLKYGLLFERFLNPERISMPDFDIDFANDGREEVIKYVTGKYGKERVGQIITFGTLGAKAVIKDVARTLDISIAESEKITKLISRDPKITLKKAFAEEPRLVEMEKDPRYAELFSLARKLEGLNRHSSIHAAGIVIGKTALIDFVPLYQEREDSKNGKGGSIATQYSMNYLEPSGLVKMDFLGLKTLDVIKYAQELIRLRGGEYSDFDVENAPEDDAAAFKMLGEGKSFGIFQFESDGMKNILRQTKPSSIEDLTALNAMYRPGPMQNIPRFVEAKNGRQPITYPDASLEKVLKETYGVIVYQEQVMEVAQIIAGFSLGHADELRRAMGKKIMEKMVKEKEKFIAGAKERGYSEKKADDIFELLIPFAGYGFNKSHAAAYSVLAYQTAYLKANFPAQFMAANLTNEMSSADKDRLSESIEEARKMGLAIDPPDVNLSGKHFNVVKDRIVYGFLGIKGLGETPASLIVQGRENGPYKSFMDFLERVDIKAVGKKVIELLVQTGAFDSLGTSRETLLGNFEKAVEYAQKKKEDKQLGQSSLFEDSGESDFPDFKFEDFPQMDRSEKLNIEKQLLGFYFSGHPLDEYREIWEKAVKVDLGQEENIKTGSCFLLGIIKHVKIITTGKGKMAFATLADFNGEIELTFFAKTWEKCQGNIEADKVAILRGKIDYQKDREKRSFIVEDLVGKHEIDSVVKEIEAQERRWDIFRNTWAYMADLKSGAIANAEKGSYTIIGFIKSLREFKDKNGNDMAFGVLQDYEGDIDLVFFSKTWNECQGLLKLDEITALKGSIDPSDSRREKPDFKVSSIADIAMLTRSASRKAAAGEEAPVSHTPVKHSVQLDEAAGDIHIRLEPDAAGRDETLYPLRDLLAGNPGGNPVFIHVPAGAIEKIIRTTGGAMAVDALKNCAGVAEVWRE